MRLTEKAARGVGIGTLAAALLASGACAAPADDGGNRQVDRVTRALSVGESWYIQFGGTMSWSQGVQLYDLDGFDTDATDVSSLAARGVEAVCYISAGSWEDWRDDASSFPAAVVGNDYPGWDGEKFLDIRNVSALAPIMQARMQMCADKGFKGVDADNIDSYTWDLDGNVTGFSLTASDAVTYATALASWAHARGLKMGQKNAPDLVPNLQPSFDFAVTESCYSDGWCGDLAPYTASGKPVFAIEYQETGVDFSAACSWSGANGVSAILKTYDLDETTQFCP
jgi:hypothetical protein